MAGRDSWQKFLELGRPRGWFWPENRPFLVSLIGEEKAKRIPIEPKNIAIERFDALFRLIRIFDLTHTFTHMYTRTTLLIHIIAKMPYQNQRIQT